MGKGYHYWGSLESPLISVYSWTNQTKELNLNSKKTPCAELFGIPFFFLGCMYIMYGIFNYTYPKKIQEFHIIRYNYTHTLIPRSYQEPLFRLRDAKKHCMTHHNLGGHIQSYFDYPNYRDFCWAPTRSRLSCHKSQWTFGQYQSMLVVSTYFKNISQIGSFPRVWMKI